MAQRTSRKECLHSFSRESKTKEPSYIIKKLKAFTLAKVLMAKRTSRKECLHSLSLDSKPKELTNIVKKKLTAFTLAEENCQFAHSVRKFGRVEDAQYNCKAFTLAEVLITLAIIGIVSALVIPSVLKNYNDKKYNTARLKALKTFGDAGEMASINDEMNTQANAINFVNNVLSKYLKISKVCDNSHSNDCGFPSQFKSSSGNTLNSSSYIKWNQIGYHSDTQVSSPINDPLMSTIISTVDGFSARVFYNPKCVRNIKESNRHIDDACMNIIYDMNGLKGPNHVGEDIGFVTTFWSGLNTISVAPGIVPYNIAKSIYDKGDMSNSDAQSACENISTKSALYTLPSVDEVSSLWINSKFVLPSNIYFLWSGSLINPKTDWHTIWAVCWYRDRNYGGGNIQTWCVRR